MVGYNLVPGLAFNLTGQALERALADFDRAAAGQADQVMVMQIGSQLVAGDAVGIDQAADRLLLGQDLEIAIDSRQSQPGQCEAGAGQDLVGAQRRAVLPDCIDDQGFLTGLTLVLLPEHFVQNLPS